MLIFPPSLPLTKQLGYASGRMARDLDCSDTESYRRGEKRPLDVLDEGNSISIASKRVNLGGKIGQHHHVCGHVHRHLIYLPFFCTFLPDDEAFVKFLVPSVVPGMIIGSAGSTIAELMDSTRTNIKFSRGLELYPGTNERICCICGPVVNVCDAIREIFARMNDPSHTRQALIFRDNCTSVPKIFPLPSFLITSGMRSCRVPWADSKCWSPTLHRE